VRRGLSCRVELNLSEHRAPAMTDVLAFNTNSRNGDVVQSRQKIEEIAIGCSEFKAKLIFKKIDSTFRGNVKEEIATALRVFKCTAAIIAPAFPVMGRTVRDGILRWVDCSRDSQVDIRCLLEKQGISPETIATIRVAKQDFENSSSDLNGHIENGKHFFIVDSESQDDLQFAVAAGIKLVRSILWVGSAGVGIAVADHIAKSQIRKSTFATTDAPLMFVIGSCHLATLQQKRELLAGTNAVEVAPTPEAIDGVLRAMHDKRHVVVTIEHGNVSESSLRQFFAGLEGIKVSAMFLTGGDTGTLACSAIGAHSIDLCDEIAPGIPWGILSGGMFHGLPVASKSGSFGHQDALLRCAEFFSRRER
jgi:D-threonate/D-erythronate kinase